MTKIKMMLIDLRKEGIRYAIRTYGWRLGALLFFYYLIRDFTLYIIFPALIASL